MSTVQMSLFERALIRLESEAAVAHGHFTPRSLARQYLLVERASGDGEIDQAVADRLSERSIRLLRSVADAPSRDVGDVAAKLAVVIVEGRNGETGDIIEAQQAILAHALAELIILADRPLPGAGVFGGMTGADLDLREEPTSEIGHNAEGGDA